MIMSYSESQIINKFGYQLKAGQFKFNPGME